MSDPDYAETFTAVSPRPVSGDAEQLARGLLEGAPAALRTFLVLGWRFGLGLRLGPRPSPEHVLGWRIVTRTPEAVRLGVASSLVRAELTIRRSGAQVMIDSSVWFRRRIARLMWRLALPAHRGILNYLLRRVTD